MEYLIIWLIIGCNGALLFEAINIIYPIERKSYLKKNPNSIFVVNNFGFYIFLIFIGYVSLAFILIYFLEIYLERRKLKKEPDFI